MYERAPLLNPPAHLVRSESSSARATWHGQLAELWGLGGDVDDERFQRLAEGEEINAVSDSESISLATASFGVSIFR